MAQNKHSYKRRDDRLRELLETALGQYQQGNKKFTTAKMAKWIGLASSSKLKAMLEQLCEEGYFQREEKLHRRAQLKNGNKTVIMKHLYSFTRETLNSVSII